MDLEFLTPCAPVSLMFTNLHTSSCYVGRYREEGGMGRGVAFKGNPRQEINPPTPRPLLPSPLTPSLPSPAWTDLQRPGRGRGVVLGADPGKGTRARVRGMAAVTRHRGHSGAVAVIHRTHQDLPAAVLRQHGLLGGVRGAAASRSKVRGAKHGARVMVSQRAASTSCPAALTDVRRATGTERLLIGGLAFSGGRAGAQVGLLS
ncbi:hypothetical protein INR49_029468 [Caranx melampygus]|nr:hypothetical protein INR49_029468 [Caranx melampygus]